MKLQANGPGMIRIVPSGGGGAATVTGASSGSAGTTCASSVSIHYWFCTVPLLPMLLDHLDTTVSHFAVPSIHKCFPLSLPKAPAVESRPQPCPPGRKTCLACLGLIRFWEKSASSIANRPAIVSSSAVLSSAKPDHCSLLRVTQVPPEANPSLASPRIAWCVFDDFSWPS